MKLSTYLNHYFKMHLKVTLWSFALFFMILKGNSEMNRPEIVKKTAPLNNIMQNHDNVLSHSSSSHSHMDHSVLVFFTPDALKVGKVIPIYFRGDNPSTSPHFLPIDEVKLIPFSTSKLPHLLKLYGFQRGSSQAKAMEDTLRQCEIKPIQGETKICATSLESMLEFVGSMLMGEFRGLSTRQMTNSGINSLQNYTIIDEPKEVMAPRMVACHTMPYPYAVLYCHYQESESKVFQVMLENGRNLVEAIAVCHMDTSHWSRTHVSFQVLGIKPGSSPVCHFFPGDNMVWVPLFDEEEPKVKLF